jgi:hypothetical protein
MLALASLVRAAVLLAATVPPPEPASLAAPAADAPVPTLVWDADPPCPDATVVRERVETLIGRPLQESGEPVHAVAIVDTRDGEPRLQLRVRSETGVSDRSISAGSCDELAEVTAVMIAVAIDPSLPVPEPAPAPEPVPEPPPPAPTKPPPAAADDRLQGFVRASAGLGWGPLPGVAPTLSGTVGVRWPHARLEIGVEHWFAQAARFADAQSVGVDVRLTTGHATGCWVPTVRPRATPRSRVEFPLCAGAAVGSLHGEGVGVPRSTPQRLVWSAGHVVAAVLYAPIRHFAFGLDARLVVPFSRSKFTLDDYGVIHTTAWAGFVVAGVVEARFP